VVAAKFGGFLLPIVSEGLAAEILVAVGIGKEVDLAVGRAFDISVLETAP
jgi:hypothetical protein